VTPSKPLCSSPRRTLLLVEDNPAEIQILQRALRALGKAVDLSIVRDGQEAVDYLFKMDGKGSPAPDLVLLDLHLPRLTGLEVLMQIRKHPRWQRLPVVVWSTSGQMEDIAAGYDAGANSFIEKPCDYERFRQVLESILRYWFETILLPPGPEHAAP
jgi:CheY-like chemotaxis protein